MKKKAVWAAVIAAVLIAGALADSEEQPDSSFEGQVAAQMESTGADVASVSYDSETGAAVVGILAADNFTAAMIRRGMLMDAMAVCEAASEMPFVTALYVRIYSGGALAMSLTADRDFLNRVNWFDMNSELFEDLAGASIRWGEGLAK